MDSVTTARYAGGDCVGPFKPSSAPMIRRPARMRFLQHTSRHGSYQFTPVGGEGTLAPVAVPPIVTGMPLELTLPLESMT